MTIEGQGQGMTQAMLANYCTLTEEENIEFPKRVTAREHPGYLGELYFIPDETGRVATAGLVELQGWSPNSVRVRVTAEAPGSVVLNRNWGDGWSASPPYQATPLHGLISARVDAGTHSIHFHYWPRVAVYGLVIGLITLSLAVAWFLRTRRTAPPDPPASTGDGRLRNSFGDPVEAHPLAPAARIGPASPRAPREGPVASCQGRLSLTLGGSPTKVRNLSQGSV